MESNMNVEITVTRLRKRLSTEQSEESNSPGPSTPSKRRGGKLAAKPQLELIEENELGNKTSKKTLAKELIETAEERPVTPTRRSARIKSNTSLVSDTTKTYDSPRAKRAARRSSQTGIDNETPITPIAATRKTRKGSSTNVDKLGVDNSSPVTSTTPLKTRRTRRNSTSSMEKLETALASSVSGITEVIIEEIDVNTTNSDNTSNKEDSTPITNSDNTSNKEDSTSVTNSNNTSNKEDSTPVKNSPKTYYNKRKLNQSDNQVKVVYEKNDDAGIKKEEISPTAQTSDNTSITANKSRLSDTSVNLLKELKTTATIKTSTLSKSTSDLEVTNNYYNKRKRAKSLTSDGQPEKMEGIFFSDNESTKLKRIAKKDKSETKFIKNKNINDFMCTESENQEKASSNSPQSSVLFDTEKPTEIDSGDQCVPVVETNDNCKNAINNFNSDSEIVKHHEVDLHNSRSNNSTYEPMDVDETVPDNILVSIVSEMNNSQIANESRKVNSLLQTDCLEERSRKSPTRSIIISEESESVHKSTLIISEIKNNSSVQSSVTESLCIENKSELNCKNIKFDHPDKMKLSLDCLTSTPLQQKKNPKQDVHINTSIINTTDQELKSKKSDSIISNESTIISASSSHSEEELSKSSNNLLDLEADVAEDDYESGDSRDEEDKQYEKENEILDKGETLSTSDNDDENDSDYEKDSFVVSSIEEDNELLSGSGDDLSMDENTLTMSKKSKAKYNKRKEKEQKKASREMFQSRHKLQKFKHKQTATTSDSSTDSESDNITSVQRYKHRRLDSTGDDVTDSIVRDTKCKKKTRKRLSESVCSDTANDDHEITIDDNDVTQVDPLSSHVKLEPQTPNKQFNISTAEINPNIEEVKVPSNVSIINNIPLQQDPLQDILESSSDAEDSKIKTNYNSMLDQLNSSKRLNYTDMSLNFKTKKTKSAKEPIVDQLNLTTTYTKMSKKKMKEQKCNKALYINNNSSDSVDLTLLFSEESSDLNLNPQNTEPYDNFIPLKRTPAKTNMLNDKAEEVIEANNTVINSAIGENSSIKKNKKKKKNKSLDKSEAISTFEDNETELSEFLPFVIDTNGERDVNTSTCSNKKKRNNSHVENTNNNNPELMENTEYDQNINTSISVNSKKYRNKSFDNKAHNESVKDENFSLNVTSQKKKNNQFDNIESTDDTNIHLSVDTKDDQEENTLMNTSMRKKKNKSSESRSNSDDENLTSNNTQAANTSNRDSSKKKKNNKSFHNNIHTESSNNDNVHITADNNQDTEEKNLSLNVSSKKKINKEIEGICHIEGDNIIEETKGGQVETISASVNSKKNKSFNDNSHIESSDIDILHSAVDNSKNTDDKNSSLNISSKKKKNKELENNSYIEGDKINIDFVEETKSDHDENILARTSSKKKKRNKSFNDNSHIESSDIDILHSAVDNSKNTDDRNSSLNNSSKKKKNKELENNSYIEGVKINIDFVEETKSDHDENILARISSKKKKKNKSFDDSSHIESSDIDNLHSAVDNSKDTDDKSSSLNINSKKKNNNKLESSYHIKSNINNEFVQEISLGLCKGKDDNISVSVSSKKKKKNTLSENVMTNFENTYTDNRQCIVDCKITEDTKISNSASPKKKKKCKSFDNNAYVESTDNENLHTKNTKENVSLKNKPKKCQDFPQDIVGIHCTDARPPVRSCSSTNNSNKEKSDHYVVTEDHQHTDSSNSLTKKKSKKNKKHSEALEKLGMLINNYSGALLILLAF
ncbi:hypothetical protein ACJJTC_008866 [Scirpophaga incertulas]